jgi:hypothetical protein
MGPAAPALGPSFTLKAAPTAPTDLRLRINLATALRLSDARPLVVAAAQAGAWASEAELARAKVLWIPTANIGFDYIRHDGGGPDFNKGIMTAPSVNYFMGGAGADLFINTAEAIFEPLAARRMLDSANYDIQTAKNDVLWQTAEAYFRVHQYRGMYSGALYTVKQGAVLSWFPRTKSIGRRACSPTWNSGPRRRGRNGESRAPISRRFYDSTPAQSSFRWNMTTFRSR